ncbi:hypothetical protein T484DRAFT_1753861 [Baffinella frigidus]|nr:hypothetical protein T484DRAFT_1753861 [Cryptophyta sp. CCMP2293]
MQPLKADAAVLDILLQQIEDSREMQQKLLTCIARRENNTSKYRGDHGAMSKGETKNHDKQKYYAQCFGLHSAMAQNSFNELVPSVPAYGRVVPTVVNVPCGVPFAPSSGKRARTDEPSTEDCKQHLACALDAIDKNGTNESILETLQHHLEETREAAHRLDEAIHKRKCKSPSKFASENVDSLSPYLKQVGAREQNYVTWFSLHITQVVAMIETTRSEIFVD